MEYPEKIVKLGRNARKHIEQHNNSEAHYQGLMQIYKMAIRKGL